jgi:hypothetical protein
MRKFSYHGTHLCHLWPEDILEEISSLSHHVFHGLFIPSLVTKTYTPWIWLLFHTRHWCCVTVHSVFVRQITKFCSNVFRTFFFSPYRPTWRTWGGTYNVSFVKWDVNLVLFYRCPRLCLYVCVCVIGVFDYVYVCVCECLYDTC